MKRLCLFFVLLPRFLFAIYYESPKPNTSIVNQGISLHPLFPKVNPILGEYMEEACDLVVAGCQELSSRRFYNHSSPPSLLYAGWRVNPESLIKANFEKVDLPLNVMIGQGNGGGILLDGRSSSSYFFNSMSQPSYTNLTSGLPSAGTNPRNFCVNYHKIDDPKSPNRFLFAGSIRDGSGKLTHFYTRMHKWHKDFVQEVRDSHGKRKIYVPPATWIPYYCLIEKEELPNGNVLKYSYIRYFDDKHFPTHYRIGSVVAYNKAGDLLGWIGFEYPESRENVTSAIQIKGSDQRVASCRVDYREVSHTVFVTKDYKKVGSSSNGYLHLAESSSAFRPRIAYTYDPYLRINQTTRPDGRIFKTEYTSDGKVKAQYAPVGMKGECLPIATFSYHTHQSHMRDAEGNLTFFNYDSALRMTKIEKFLKGDVPVLSELYQWSEQGDLLSKSLEDSSQKCPLTVRYVYDERGNVLEEHLIGNLTGVKEDECYTIYRTYSKDRFNLKLSETEGSDKIIRYHYLPNTNLLIAELTYEKETIRKRIFHEYDESAICVKTIEDDGGSTDSFDLKGVSFRKITEIVPKKSLPCYGLAQTILEKTIDAEGNEILLSRIDYTYHPSGKILKETHYDSTNTPCYTLVNEYDSQEQLISTTNALGHKKTFSYDANFNLLSEKGPNGEFKEWIYDLADRPIVENDSGLITQKTYDPLGRVLSSLDPCGNATHYLYDALGRVIQVTYPDGGIEKNSYDILGNIIQKTDPNGYVTLKEYTCRGQPTYILYPDGTEEVFRYHLDGTLAFHVDRNGAKTSYRYDLFQRPVAIETPTGCTQSTYSTFNKITDTDAEGVLTRYFYDYAGRKTDERTAGKETYYFYDTLGRLTHTQVGEVLHIQIFDFLDQCIEKRREDLGGAITFQENYAYDGAGNQTHIVTCAGVTQTTYNAHRLPI